MIYRTEPGDPWEHDFVYVLPPLREVLRLSTCRRYDVIARLANRIGIPKGVELDLGTQHLLWNLYDLVTEAHQWNVLRPEKAGGLIGQALARCDRAGHYVGLVDELELATPAAVRRHFEPATRALIGRALGQPRPPHRGRRAA